MLDRRTWAVPLRPRPRGRLQTITKIERAKRHAGIADYIEHEKYRRAPRPSPSAGRPARPSLRPRRRAGERARRRSASVPPDLDERALRWITAAADQARASEMLPTAVRLYTQALGLLDDEPDARAPRAPARSGGRPRSRAGTSTTPATTPRPPRPSPTCSASRTPRPCVRALGVILAAARATRRGAPRRRAPGGRRVRAPDDTPGVADALRQLGHVEMFAGDLDEADGVVSPRRSTRSSTIDDRTGEAWAAQNLAWIAFVTGRLDVAAERRIERRRDLRRDRRHAAGMAWALGLLAYVRFQQGRCRRGGGARPSRSSSEAREPRRPVGGGMMLMLLGIGPAVVGSHRRGRGPSERGRDEFDDLGDRYGLTHVVGLARARAGHGRAGRGRLRALVENGRRCRRHERHRSDRRAVGRRARWRAPRSACRSAIRRSVDERSRRWRGATSVTAPRRRARAPGRPGPGGDAARRRRGRPRPPRPRLARRRGAAATPSWPPWPCSPRLEGSGDVAVESPSASSPPVASTYLDRMYGRPRGRAGRRPPGRRAGGGGPASSARLAVMQTHRRPCRHRRHAARGRVGAGRGLGEGYAGGPTGDARTRLDAMGIRAEGWSRLFDLAAGVTASADPSAHRSGPDATRTPTGAGVLVQVRSPGRARGDSTTAWAAWCSAGTASCASQPFGNISLASSSETARDDDHVLALLPVDRGGDLVAWR